MADVTSVRNALVKEARRLGRTRARDEERLLVESPGPVEAAVAAGACRELFVVDEQIDDHAAVVDAARAGGARVHTVTAAVLDALAATRSPQGLVAVVAWPLPEVEEALAGATLAVVAVDCGDPGNVGTLVRTADAAGADAVVLVGGADPRGAKAVRASAGSLFHLPVVVAEWDAVARDARGAGLALVATHADAALAHHRRDWTGASAIVLGSEAHGLPAEVVADCDEVVAVPLRGRAESLNVAVTGAVVLYEAVRQRTDVAALPTGNS